MGKSSRDQRDIYYREAKEKGYRARSAFKLIQLNLELEILKEHSTVLDLCSAPGSWSQVLVALGMNVIAVDLQKQYDLDGVTFLQADITKFETVRKVRQLIMEKNRNNESENVGELKLEGEDLTSDKCAIVVCDGAPDVTGLHDLDEFLQHELVIAALTITEQVLEVGGTFVAKVFRGKNVDLLVAALETKFHSVMICKPRASRDSSIEAFAVCRLFRGYTELSNQLDGMRIKPKFRACGDLDLDADMTYRLEEGYKSLDVIAQPIDSPWKGSN